MNTRSRIEIIVVTILGGLILWLSLKEPVSAQQPVVLPNGEQVRFELVGNEPIAGPDGRALVSDWTVMMFRDRKSNRCYVAFRHAGAIAVETADACRE